MKTLMLGVGNVLLSDEGVGVRVIEEFVNRYEIPEDVEVIDGGTLGLNLLYFLDNADRLLVVDALLGGEPPGSLYKFKGDQVKIYFRGKKLSAHDIGLQEVLSVAELIDKGPKEIVVIGVEPESLDVSLDLSPSVRRILERLLNEVVEQLKEWGIKVKVRNEADKLKRTSNP